jgi:hypothetical protein
MSVATVALLLCALVIAALAVAVERLHARLRGLGIELAELAEAQRRDAAADSGLVSVEPAPAIAAADVAVITALPDADDNVDVTARRVVSVTLVRPMIKIAALSYGIRHALDDEVRFKVRYAMRREYRRQRKMRRRRRAGRAASMGWRL